MCFTNLQRKKKSGDQFIFGNSCPSAVVTVATNQHRPVRLSHSDGKYGRVNSRQALNWFIFVHKTFISITATRPKNDDEIIVKWFYLSAPMLFLSLIARKLHTIYLIVCRLKCCRCVTVWKRYFMFERQYAWNERMRWCARAKAKQKRRKFSTRHGKNNHFPHNNLRACLVHCCCCCSIPL